MLVPNFSPSGATIDWTKLSISGTKYRSQLNSLPLGRLFLHGDLLELPVVKEVMEENEYRLPITSERWLRVANSFPDIVAAHCKVIEMDCVKKIREARDAAFVASKSSRHRLHASVDAVDLDHAQGTGKRRSTHLDVPPFRHRTIQTWIFFLAGKLRGIFYARGHL